MLRDSSVLPTVDLSTLAAVVWGQSTVAVRPVTGTGKGAKNAPAPSSKRAPAVRNVAGTAHKSTAARGASKASKLANIAENDWKDADDSLFEGDNYKPGHCVYLLAKGKSAHSFCGATAKCGPVINNKQEYILCKTCSNKNHGKALIAEYQEAFNRGEPLNIKKKRYEAYMLRRGRGEGFVNVSHVAGSAPLPGSNFNSEVPGLGIKPETLPVSTRKPPVLKACVIGQSADVINHQVTRMGTVTEKDMQIPTFHMTEYNYIISYGTGDGNGAIYVRAYSEDKKKIQELTPQQIEVAKSQGFNIHSSVYESKMKETEEVSSIPQLGSFSRPKINTLPVQNAGPPSSTTLSKEAKISADLGGLPNFSKFASSSVPTVPQLSTSLKKESSGSVIELPPTDENDNLPIPSSKFKVGAPPPLDSDDEGEEEEEEEEEYTADDGDDEQSSS